VSDDTDRDRLDPDVVPPELAAADGQTVHLLTDDGVASGQLYVSANALRPRRRRDDDGDT